MKKYLVEVSFQGDRMVTVSARNEREACSKARIRVRRMSIGTAIRPDWTDAQEIE
jgi:hypothetical protein